MKRNEMKKEENKLIAKRESKNGTESEMIFADLGLFLFRIHNTVTKNNKYVTLDKITHMKGSMQLVQ